MAFDNENAYFDIQGNYGEADFLREKGEAELALYKEFRQLRREFLIVAGILFVGLPLLASVAGSIFQIIVMENLFLYILLLIGIFLGGWEIHVLKRFKRAEQRFSYRLNSLAEKVTKVGEYVSIDQEDINKTIRTAKLNYGVPIKQILLGLALLGLAVLLYGVIETGLFLRFQPALWDSTFWRKQQVSVLNNDIMSAVYSDVTQPQYNFAEMTRDELYALIGVPEARITAYIVGGKTELGDSYKGKMGRPPVFQIDASKVFEQISHDAFYCGKNKGKSIWLCVFWKDDKLFYSTVVETGDGTMEIADHALTDYLLQEETTNGD